MGVHDLLNKMASAEDEFLETEFMAPVLHGGRVQVRIAGIVVTLRVMGDAEPGWALLKPLSMDRARVVGRPSLRQVRDYLALFPLFRLLLLSRSEEGAELAGAARPPGRYTSPEQRPGSPPLGDRGPTLSTGPGPL